MTGTAILLFRTKIKTMQTIKLDRTGQRSLAFTGEQIADATTRDRDSFRWTTVRVFRTESGKIILGTGFYSCWDGERDSLSAESFSDLESMVSRIEETVPELAGQIAEKLNVTENI